jgi:2-methylcitrate dehydratase PrpD
MSETIARRLGSFVSDLAYETIPEETKEGVRLSFLDTVGCMLYGCSTQQGKIIKKAAFRMQCSNGAAVVGEPWTVSAPLACLVNGALAGSMAFDDIHHKATVHCGCVAVPAALASADIADAPVSGKDFLTALVAGYEVMIRVALSIMPAVRLRGYHPASVVGGFCGSAAAGKILGLSAMQLTDALGIGGGLCSGLMSAQLTSMIHGMQAPNAGMQGVYAACFAREGLVGSRSLFEESYGSFPGAVAGSFNPNMVLDGLGTTFEAGNVGIKYYPTAGSVSSALDAITRVLETSRLDARNVAEVTVYVNKAVFLHCGFEYEPGLAAGAQMSIKYCVAALLERHEVTASQFEQECINDTAVRRRMKAVHVVHDASMDDLGPQLGYWSKVELKTIDGKIFRAETVDPKGSSKNKLSLEEVRIKFLRQACTVISPEAAVDLAAIVLSCDTIEDMRVFTRVLAGIPLSPEHRVC